MRPSLSIHIQLPSNLGLKGFEATTALPSPRSVNCPMTILAVLGSTHSRMQFVACYTPHFASSCQNGEGNCPGGRRLRNVATLRVGGDPSPCTPSALGSPAYT